MSRDLNQLTKLNTVDDGKRDDGKNEAELQMFSDTHFFDLDIGRSTDIATTVDELLMQQEKQIQYPQKPQPLYEDTAGPSYVPSQQHMFPAAVHQQQARQQAQQAQQQSQIPFDFTPFSLADELPQTSLSILDIDPLFHPNGQQQQQQQPQQQQPQQQRSQQQSQQQRQFQQQFQPVHPHPTQHQQHQQQHAVDIAPLRPTKNRPMQRHELAELYAPKSEAVSDAEEQAKHEESSSGTEHIPANDDEKRRRNTAASARFRIKKKLREQEMEKNLKVMQQRLSEQDERIKQLEMENTWLKNLVVEKNTERESSSLGKLRAAFMQNNS